MEQIDRTKRQEAGRKVLREAGFTNENEILAIFASPPAKKKETKQTPVIAAPQPQQPQPARGPHPNQGAPAQPAARRDGVQPQIEAHRPQREVVPALQQQRVAPVRPGPVFPVPDNNRMPPLNQLIEARPNRLAPRALHQNPNGVAPVAQQVAADNNPRLQGEVEPPHRRRVQDFLQGVLNHLRTQGAVNGPVYQRALWHAAIGLVLYFVVIFFLWSMAA